MTLQITMDGPLLLVASVQNVVDGGGIPIAITGMAIVFVALSLITAFIALMPRALNALSRFLPPETDRYAVAPASSAEVDDEVLAAIGFALHVQRRGP